MGHDVVRFFAGQELTSDFTEHELFQFVDLLKEERFNAGELIIEENKNYDAIHFLYHGEVDVLKYDEHKKKLFPISHLKKGSAFGEMTFLDQKPASASIQAVTDCTVWLLPRTNIQALPFYQKLIANIAKSQINRLRVTNGSFVKSLQMSLHHEQLRSEFGTFFIVTMVLFSLISFIPSQTNFSPIVHVLYATASILIILLPVIYFIKRQSAPLTTFGVTIRGWKKSVLEGIVVSLLLIPAAVLVKTLTQPAAEALFTWRNMAHYNQGERLLYLAMYIPHSCLQEFVARGVMQGSLARFMDKTHYMTPILLTGFMFGMFHVHFGMFFAVLTFLVSIVFGYIYHRHDNLIGVSIVHYTLGVVSIALGLY